MCEGCSEEQCPMTISVYLCTTVQQLQISHSCRLQWGAKTISVFLCTMVHQLQLSNSCGDEQRRYNYSSIQQLHLSDTAAVWSKNDISLIFLTYSSCVEPYFDCYSIQIIHSMVGSFCYWWYHWIKPVKGLVILQAFKLFLLFLGVRLLTKYTE